MNTRKKITALQAKIAKIEARIDALYEQQTAIENQLEQQLRLYTGLEGDSGLLVTPSLLAYDPHVGEYFRVGDVGAMSGLQLYDDDMVNVSIGAGYHLEVPLKIAQEMHRKWKRQFLTEVEEVISASVKAISYKPGETSARTSTRAARAG